MSGIYLVLTKYQIWIRDTRPVNWIWQMQLQQQQSKPTASRGSWRILVWCRTERTAASSSTTQLRVCSGDIAKLFEGESRSWTTEPRTLSLSVKIDLLEQRKTCTFDQLTFPPQRCGKRDIKLQETWLKSYFRFVFSPLCNGGFCLPCALFSPPNLRMWGCSFLEIALLFSFLRHEFVLMMKIPNHNFVDWRTVYALSLHVCFMKISNFTDHPYPK